MVLAAFGGHGISATRFKAHCLGVHGYRFKYYGLWDTAATHAYHPNNWSCECCWMHTCLAQSSLRQEVDRVYPTTNRPLGSRSWQDHPQSQCGPPVQNRGVPEMGDLLGGTGYSWKYPWSIMFQRYMSDLQSKVHRGARTRVQRGAFAGHLLNGIIPFWSCPVHAWDVDLSIFSFVGWTIEPTDSRVQIDMDAMNSIVLSSFDACCTIQLLCHTISPLHFTH